MSELCGGNLRSVFVLRLLSQIPLGDTYDAPLKGSGLPMCIIRWNSHDAQPNGSGIVLQIRLGDLSAHKTDCIRWSPGCDGND